MDKFIVSARKYRPITFRDVVGQPSIVSTLKLSIANGHLGHAYLFSGPRGVGKTTCARIFARTINCSETGPDGEACNSCESCRSFNENRSFSIHELDAASNNTVEDIRNLTDKVRIPPQIGRYSIYIIDEVHMLSQQAFNAFLKTLEEPPAHAIFILATTEKHKIIPTILSRCQIFDFNRIRVEDTVEYLKTIAGKESVSFEEEALHVIAQKADGAMRDALSIFDQAVSFSGGKITYKEVIDNLNILDTEYYFRLTAQALEGDVSSMLLLFNEVLSRGFDARNFINGYAAHLRDLMVCKDPGTLSLLEVGAGFREKYQTQSAQASLKFLYEGLDICNQADIQFRNSRNQRLTIELALVKLAHLGGIQKKKPVAEDLEASPPAPPVEKEASGQMADTGSKEATGDPVQQPATSDGNGTSRVVRKPSISIKDSLKGDADKLPEADGYKPDEEVSEGSGSGDSPGTEQILKAWNDFARSVEKSHPRLFNTLRNSEPLVGSDGSLEVLLNTEAQQDSFLKVRSKLLDYVEEATGFRPPGIVTRVEEPEENGKKIYTDQDRLEFLIKKNPDLGEMKSRFTLDFDQ